MQAVFERHTLAYGKSLVVTTKPARVISVFGYNAGPLQWLQIHDAKAVPAEAAVPLHIFKAAAADNFSSIIPVCGLPTSNGIVITNSSTGPTKTIGGDDCWITVVYQEAT